MRTAKIDRKTNETDIQISLNLDGTGKSEIAGMSIENQAAGILL